MAQDVVIAGALFSDVPQISVPDGNGTYHPFCDPSETTATAADVAEGKKFLNASGVLTTGTGSGGSSTDFIITLVYNPAQDMWLYANSIAPIKEAYEAGKTLVAYADGASASDETATASGVYDEAAETYTYYVYFTKSNKRVMYKHILRSNRTSVSRSDVIYSPEDVTTLTAISNGTYSPADDGALAYSSVTVNIEQNIIQGEFTSQTPGEILTIDLPFTGHGYPIALAVYVADGPYDSTSDYYKLIQRYAVAHYQAIKSNMDTFPAYTGASPQYDGFSCVCRYKNNGSTATSYTQAASSAFVVCSQSDPNTSNYFQVVRMPSATRMKVLISDGSKVGFVAGIKYAYYVIYRIT